MGVKIRFQRFGVTHNPVYRIVAAHNKGPRDGKFIEKLGTYNPKADNNGNKQLRLNVERTKYWLGVGAQPSDHVGRLLSKFNIWISAPHQAPFMMDMTRLERPVPTSDVPLPFGPGSSQGRESEK